MLDIPAIVLWPNADAGSEDVSRGMRKFRENDRDTNMHFFKNLPIETYVRLMESTACLIGNSSSAIREGAYIGTPSVNIGTRQSGRERGVNVMDAGHDRDEIAAAIEKQLGKGRYPLDDVYGDGNAGKKIAAILAGLQEIDVQKRISY
jgi:UDP-N-acetylglucosamine 2-epimerase